MNWRDVTVIGMLVVGSVTAGMFGQAQLAGVLAGAAAGMVTPRALPAAPKLNSIAPLLGALGGGGVAVGVAHLIGG